MQEHNIDELFGLLKEHMDQEHPGWGTLKKSYDRKLIILSVVDTAVSYNFTLADENVLVVAHGEYVKWEDATDADLQRAVEYAENWYNDKAGEL